MMSYQRWIVVTEVLSGSNNSLGLGVSCQVWVFENIKCMLHVSGFLCVKHYFSVNVDLRSTEYFRQKS